MVNLGLRLSKHGLAHAFRDNSKGIVYLVDWLCTRDFIEHLKDPTKPIEAIVPDARVSGSAELSELLPRV